MSFSRSAQQLKREQKAQMNRDAGLVSENFPHVAKITFVLTYYHIGAIPVLMVRTINFLPGSAANFKMNCAIPGCEGGGFDLTRIIADAAKAHKKILKGNLACTGTSELLPKDHASIDYTITMEYKDSLN